MTASVQPRRFQLGVRPLARAEAEKRFDAVQRASGVDYSKLSADEQREYDTERAGYARCCVALWAREVHASVMRAADRPAMPAPAPPTAPRQRPRERRAPTSRACARSPGRQADDDEPADAVTRQPGGALVSVPRRCQTFEEELRLGGELLARDVLGELVDALAVLYDVLADRASEHEGDAS